MNEYMTRWRFASASREINRIATETKDPIPSPIANSVLKNLFPGDAVTVLIREVHKTIPVRVKAHITRRIGNCQYKGQADEDAFGITAVRRNTTLHFACRHILELRK